MMMTKQVLWVVEVKRKTLPQAPLQLQLKSPSVLKLAQTVFLQILDFLVSVQ